MKNSRKNKKIHKHKKLRRRERSSIINLRAFRRNRRKSKAKKRQRKLSENSRQLKKGKTVENPAEETFHGQKGGRACDQYLFCGNTRRHISRREIREKVIFPALFTHLEFFWGFLKAFGERWSRRVSAARALSGRIKGNGSRKSCVLYELYGLSYGLCL